MIVSRTFFLFGICLLCSCGVSNSQRLSYILDDGLKEVVLNADKARSKTRTVLAFSNHKKADDCISYYQYSKEEVLVETVNNQIVKNEYLICDALDILSSAEIYSGDIDSTSIGEALLERLDLRTFSHSMHRAADNSNFTFEKIFPDESRVNGAGVTLDMEDWSLTLHAVAVADVNKNGMQDWVVQMADESKGGNYRHYATFIIFDPEKNTFLSAMKYP